MFQGREKVFSCFVQVYCCFKSVRCFDSLALLINTSTSPGVSSIANPSLRLDASGFHLPLLVFDASQQGRHHSVLRLWGPRWWWQFVACEHWSFINFNRKCITSKACVHGMWRMSRRNETEQPHCIGCVCELLQILLVLSSIDITASAACLSSWKDFNSCPAIRQNRRFLKNKHIVARLCRRNETGQPYGNKGAPANYDGFIWSLLGTPHPIRRWWMPKSQRGRKGHKSDLSLHAATWNLTTTT